VSSLIGGVNSLRESNPVNFKAVVLRLRQGTRAWKIEKIVVVFCGLFREKIRKPFTKAFICVKI